MKLHAIALAVLMLASGASSVLAQTIPSYPLRYKHDCSVRHEAPSMFAPPYSSNMPLEVFQTYFAIDSLCRGIPEAMKYRAMVAAFDDTLTSADMAWMLPFIYRTIDYDPFRVFSYAKLAKYLNSNYKLKPYWVYEYLLAHARRGTFNKVDGLIALSAGIYHLRITDVTLDSLPNSLTSPKPMICVTAEVLTSFKGTPLCVSKTDPEGGADILELKFSYLKRWKTITYNSDTPIYGRGTHYLPDEYGFRGDPTIGDECILFADVYLESHVDSLGMPFMINPIGGFSRNGGLYSITNGNVVDYQNFFGQGTSVSKNTFMTELQSRINNLLGI